MISSRVFIFLLLSQVLIITSLSQDLSYRLSPPSGSTLQQKQLATGVLDVYISQTTQEGFRYALTVTTMDTSEKEGSVFDTFFKEEYLKGCGCTLSDGRKVQYGNAKGILFNMEKVEAGVTYQCYSFNAVKDEKLFNVIYMTTPDKFSNYESEFNKVMESFEVL